MDAIDGLIRLFTEFPGIGARQARRFVFFLLTKDKTYLANLAKKIAEVRDNIRRCEHCMRFFSSDSGVALCHICADPHINKTSLMIVAKDVDLESVRKSGAFDGRYFVLGDTLPILEKNPEKKIRQKSLLAEVDRAIKEDQLTEIICAFAANIEGEHTTMYVKKLLEGVVGKGVKFSVLGRGLSTGTELEYSDADTLKNALRHRDTM